jgi:peptidoglycan hydrolase-like protein with peptidoglycan-binding domain
LALNDTGDAVKTLQTRLNAWHANPQLKVDGSFGLGTQGAVKAFQAALHLTVDGVVGPATWTALLKTPPVLGFGAPVKLDIGRQWVASWQAPPDVAGHGPTGYHVHLIKNGQVIQTNDVPVPEAVYEGLSGSYEVEVHANGGPGTPLSAKISFSA